MPKPFVPRKPREDYSELIDEIEHKFATLATRNTRLASNSKSPVRKVLKQPPSPEKFYRDDNFSASPAKRI